jgi:hypothetical protein
MKPKPTRVSSSPGRKDPWHAVSVVGGTPACTAVAKLRGRRFLAEEAPRLPIVDCSAPASCRCTYRHFADRRATLRRAADRGMAGRYAGVERRSAPSRRMDDDGKAPTAKE